jgi:hypothetical protein
LERAASDDADVNFSVGVADGNTFWKISHVIDYRRAGARVKDALAGSRNNTRA